MTDIEALFVVTGTSISICALVHSAWTCHRSVKTARLDQNRVQRFIATAPPHLLQPAPITMNRGIDPAAQKKPSDRTS